MLNEIVLKLGEWYHKANINTTMGSSVPTLARDIEILAPILGRSNVCPYRYAATEVEQRKEKYARRILHNLRKQGREQEGIDYLRSHFPLHLDHIVNGEPIPDYVLS